MLMSLGEPARRGECQMRWDTFEGQHQDEQEELWAAEDQFRIQDSQSLSSSELSPGGTEQSPVVASCQFLGLGSSSVAPLARVGKSLPSLNPALVFVCSRDFFLQLSSSLLLLIF